MTEPAGEPATRPLPPPHTSWVRRHLRLTGLLAGLIAIAAIGTIAATVIVSSGGGGGARRPAPGQPYPSTAPAPQTVTVTDGAKWLSGRAGKLLAAVNSDLGTLSSAERAGHHGAAQVAGRRLAADAQAAARGPMPPVAARAYRYALAELQRAGAYAASGNASKVTQLLEVGGLHIAKVAAAVDAPAG
jgi:hypothetical protein